MATTTTSVSGAIPAAFETFYTEGAEGQPGLIPQAFNLYGQGTPEGYFAKYVDPMQAAGLFGAGRIAPLSGTQQQIGAELGSLTTPNQFALGTQAAQTGLGGLAGLLGQDAMSVYAPQLTQYQMSAPQAFGGEQALQYMSPYVQNVVDIQKRQAITDAQKQQLMANLGAARQGTYGGARQLLAGTERERALGTQLGDIQAKGLQSAYENAQQQFERDRAAGMTTGQQNLQALLNVQQLGAGQSMESQRANQAAQLQAAQQRQQAALGLGSLGQQLGQLGVAQQASTLDRLKTLGAYGDLERAYEQQQIDARYQDLMRGIEYPETQLTNLSNFIRGIPISDTTTTTTTPPPSFASQLAGLGLSGLSLYNLLNPK